MRHDMTDGEREDFEERAAIVEFEHGWPRPIAEAEAQRAVMRARWLSTRYRVGWIQPPCGDDGTQGAGIAGQADRDRLPMDRHRSLQC